MLFCKQIKDTVNLIIDIGNTIAKLAVFDEGNLLEVKYSSNKTLSDLKDFCNKYRIGKCIVSTVVDLSEEARRAIGIVDVPVLFMNSNIKLPVNNKYSTPKTLGSDRIAAVVGANGYYPNRNILVIDAGTCITYDFIDSSNNYLGGNISPGLDMRLKALNFYTSRLPLVDKNGVCPEIGYDTETAIRAGVTKGIQLEMEGYIIEMQRKYPDLFVFLTGGYEFSFDIKLKNKIFADRFLVLKGLNRLLEYNEGL